MAPRNLGEARSAAALRGSARRGTADLRPVPDVLVRLVSRLIFAQAGATAAIGTSYSKRTVPWLVLPIIAAVALCGLAWLVRSGGQATWLAAICVESCLAAVGLFSFAYKGYLGGTLLSLVTLGTLLHPTVARTFATAPRWRRSAAGSAVLAEATGLPNGGAQAHNGVLSHNGVLAHNTGLGAGGAEALQDPVG